MITEFKVGQWYAYNPAKVSKWLSANRAESDEKLYDELKGGAFKVLELNGYGYHAEVMRILSHDNRIFDADDFDQSCLFNFCDKDVLYEVDGKYIIESTSNKASIEDKLKQIEALIEEIRCLQK
ncbi:hypothetical protein BI049_gp062 [Salmonella phage vB_SnwM_CGG4-1]|uniref:Uncharacterized protein n=1 Tax=Salmonella phage vB_SnwM_CGG4-1 TaxID=1815631 RepID=A0A1B0VV80_9CAUD|nr:hypothetical protein BI049_gp062 [Salmonella phage vB_SnwM_CGG4-1]ANA49416.1 hypothetical protein CGG41_062 [Salmonella phage vB_SnwM_CGG4-1]